MNQIIALLCALLISTNAGAPVARDSSDFHSFLRETNAAHARIDAPTTELEAFRYDFDNGKPLFSLEDGALLRAYDGESPKLTDLLSAKEARDEVAWLFRLFRTQYGLYLFSGGDAAFEKAEADILGSLPQEGSIALKDYKALLIEHLAFIEDTHLVIDDHSFGPNLILFGNESRPYYYRDGTFYTDAAGTDPIRSIDGQPPEDCLKRAIGQSGELVWYPYKLAPRGDHLSLVMETAGGRIPLTLSPSKSLETRPHSADPYAFSLREGLPFVELNLMVFGDGDQSGWAAQNEEAAKQAFLASASKIKEYPAAVIDLSHNPGGNGDLPPEWFRAYTGEEAQPNYCTLRIRSRQEWLRSGYGAENEEQEEQLLRQMDEYWAQSGLKADGSYYVSEPAPQFVEEDGPLLFVLTSRGTASAAEGFTDMAHNLNDLVVIGANTGGVLTNAANYGLELPYSGMFFQFGECLFSWDQDYFSEGAGMAPDLYLTGENLDKRLNLFLKRYVGMR